jgi:hypothetical protein
MLRAWQPSRNGTVDRFAFGIHFAAPSTRFASRVFAARRPKSSTTSDTKR